MLHFILNAISYRILKLLRLFGIGEDGFCNICGGAFPIEDLWDIENTDETERTVYFTACEPCAAQSLLDLMGATE